MANLLCDRWNPLHNVQILVFRILDQSVFIIHTGKDLPRCMYSTEYTIGDLYKKNRKTPLFSI